MYIPFKLFFLYLIKPNLYSTPESFKLKTVSNIIRNKKK